MPTAGEFVSDQEKSINMLVAISAISTVLFTLCCHNTVHHFEMVYLQSAICFGLVKNTVRSQKTTLTHSMNKSVSVSGLIVLHANWGKKCDFDKNRI